MSLGSREYKEVYGLVTEYDKKLRADDKRLHSNCVRLVTNDSSTFVEDAFLMRYEDWWIIFAEHDHPRLYHADDVIYWSEYKKIYVGSEAYQKLGKEELK